MSDPPAESPLCPHAHTHPSAGPRRAAAPGAGGDLTAAPPREAGAAVDGAAARLTMEQPVACVIRVRGSLDPQWAPRLGGLRITPAAGGDGEAVTELRGALPDQAAVQEVLHTLHTLGFSLQRLTCAPRRRP